MGEKLEKQICESCGADVRLNALFCFNCGSQVASDEAVEAENINDKSVSDAWFKEEIAVVPQDTKSVATSNKKTKVVVKEKTKTLEKIITTETTENGQVEKIAPENSIKLKSAANLRDKSKLGGKKTVEIEWTEPRSAPNIWFLLVSLILAGVAAFTLFAMIYLR